MEKDGFIADSFTMVSDALKNGQIVVVTNGKH